MSTVEIHRKQHKHAVLPSCHLSKVRAHDGHFRLQASVYGFSRVVASQQEIREIGRFNKTFNE